MINMIILQILYALMATVRFYLMNNTAWNIWDNYILYFLLENYVYNLINYDVHYLEMLRLNSGNIWAAVFIDRCFELPCKSVTI